MDTLGAILKNIPVQMKMGFHRATLGENLATFPPSGHTACRTRSSILSHSLPQCPSDIHTFYSYTMDLSTKGSYCIHTPWISVVRGATGLPDNLTFQQKATSIYEINLKKDYLTKQHSFMRRELSCLPANLNTKEFYAYTYLCNPTSLSLSLSLSLSKTTVLFFCDSG